VPDPLTRSLRYRERAAECRKLAKISVTPDLQAEYENLALRYDEIADAELKIANADRLNKAN
jgi:hypothetical protein